MHVYIYIYMGDKSTPWERAWRSGRTCTVFRDQTADIYIYIWRERKRDSLFGRAKAPYVCMWCQPVTRYSVGWSVLSEHTHARVYLLRKKRPLSPLPPRHVHSTDMGYHRGRSSDPQGVPGDTKYVTVYTKTSNILWSSRDQVINVEIVSPRWFCIRYIHIIFFYEIPKRLHHIYNVMLLILTNILKMLTAIYKFIWPETNYRKIWNKQIDKWHLTVLGIITN